MFICMQPSPITATTGLLIIAGSRLDIRQTGADTKFFENRPIFHIDCEEEEINNRVKGCIPIVADVKEFFNILALYDIKIDQGHFEVALADLSSG